MTPMRNESHSDLINIPAPTGDEGSVLDRLSLEDNHRSIFETPLPPSGGVIILGHINQVVQYIFYEYT